MRKKHIKRNQDSKGETLGQTGQCWTKLTANNINEHWSSALEQGHLLERDVGKVNDLNIGGSSVLPLKSATRQT
ncbi:hypothetical protein AOLI_G00090160 [Acnodon oligacanthus]